MEKVIEKRFPTIEELLPASEVITSDQTECGQLHVRRGIISKQKFEKRANVILQYRCPVDGCLYDSKSQRHFAQLRYLRQHYKKVHADKRHLCHRCQRGFANSSDHTAHEDVCGNRYQCECGVSYSTREALQTHCRRKGHLLPPQYSANRRSSLANAKTSNRLSSSPAPAMVVVINHFLSGAATLLPQTTTQQQSRFILPKSAPLHSVPLPTVAAMALSELSTGPGLVQGVTTKTETATQTEEGARRSVGCSPSKRSSLDTRRRSTRSTRRSTETQTATSRKRSRTSERCRATQTLRFRKPKSGECSSTAPSAASYSFEEAGTQTLSLYRNMIDSIQGETADGGDWSLPDMAFAAGGSGGVAGTSAMELEVDINFQLSAVSSATQTSPRVRMQQRQQGLLTSLRGFLTSMGEAEDRNSGAGPYGGDPRRCQLSSHTQTEADELDRLLLTGGGDSDGEEEGAVGGILSCTDIHTQTTEDLLHDIPYEQLLSAHMETQTSDEDALFSELNGCLCDIQTQTTLPDYGGEDSAGGGGHSAAATAVNIHTQTPHVEELFWRTSAPSLPQPPPTNHTETQTFPSLLDMCYDSALIDSHTQTPGNWADDLLNAQLLFQ